MNKKKFYCKNQANSNKRNEELTEGITGFLITTDRNKEKNCVRDTYNILNDAIERVYGHDTGVKLQKTSEVTGVVTKGETITDKLENELESMRTNKRKAFYNFETNCKGVVFIKMDKDISYSVKDLAKDLIELVKNTKEQLSRSISRFIPVELGMKAKLDIFKIRAPSILDKYFPKGNEIRRSWKVEFKSRNNNSIHKEDFLDFVLSYIDKEFYYVDYKQPELTVIIEITNDLLCFSVIENYFENKCYNLMTLSKTEEELKQEREKLINTQKQKEKEKILDSIKETKDVSAVQDEINLDDNEEIDLI